MGSASDSGPGAMSVRYGAVGAAVSALLLIGMAFVRLPAGLEYPGLPALTGSVLLSPGDSNAFLDGLRTLFALDSLFLLGWILAWIGLADLVGRRSDGVKATVVLVLGLAGALMDFGENGIILGAMGNLASGSAATGNWTIAWKAVQHLSYALPFAGALSSSVHLWGLGLPGKVTAFAGTVLLIPAAAGLYIPALSLVSNLWFLVWFLCLAILLWTRADGPAVRKG